MTPSRAFKAVWTILADLGAIVFLALALVTVVWGPLFGLLGAGVAWAVRRVVLR